MEMTNGTTLRRLGGGAATGLMLTALLALAIWTGVTAVSRVGHELALALRWASPGL